MLHDARGRGSYLKNNEGFSNYILFTTLFIHIMFNILHLSQTRMQAIQSTVDRTANAGPLETIMEDEEFVTAKSKGKKK